MTALQNRRPNAAADPLPADLPVANRTRLTVVADADPGALPRILEQFAQRQLVPSLWHSRAARGRLDVDIVVDDLPSALAERIAARLRQIVGVRSVAWRAPREVPGA